MRTLAALAFINIFLTFLFQWFIVTTLGAGMETDALYAGMVVPQMLLAVVSGSLLHVLVPIFTREKDNNFRLITWSFFSWYLFRFY